jgi:hypothetical protein
MEDHNSKGHRMFKRILRHRWLWGVIGFGVFFIWVLVALPFGIDYGIERYFLANGADQAMVEDIDFNLFTRRLVVKKLIVKRGQQEVLNVSRAGFTLRWVPFFKKRLLIKQIDLSDSYIIIEAEPNGRWRIGGLLSEPSANKSDGASWGFGLAEFQLQDSLLKFRSPQLSSELKIERARLKRLRTWLPEQKARLEFTGQINDGRLQFQGDFSPFGNDTEVDGSMQIQELTLNPFSELIAGAPDMLQGRLDAAMRLQGKYGSKNGFTFDQSGRLALKQTRMRFGDVELTDGHIRWDGSTQIIVPRTRDGFQITASGVLDGREGAVKPSAENFALRHGGLNWNGKFALARKPTTTDITFEGALNLREFDMAGAGLNLDEENLTWNGSVQMNIPPATDLLSISASGQLEAKNAVLKLTSANLELKDRGLDWNGNFAFDQKQGSKDISIEGKLTLDALDAAANNVNLAQENFLWNGSLEFLLPENNEDHRLTSRGKLESGRQKIALLRKNLVMAGGRLLWEGQFSSGLTNFSDPLAAEGDFSLTDLAITDTQKNLRLLASRAVDLKSIQGEADGQFNVAAIKITGLDLATKPGSSEKTSLFSASELTVDTVKIEHLKKVSIDSARIVDAKGVLRHKSDGGWLYIEDLPANTADPASRAKRKQPDSKSKPADQTGRNGFGIRIGSLQIAGDSVLQFEDDTVSPSYRTEVRLKEASLENLDSLKPEQPSPLRLEASSRKYTRIKLNGNIQPFAERIGLDVKGKIEAFELPPLSPYAARAIGYQLTSGEADADIDLKITRGKLDGEGQFLFYRPRVEAVKGEKLKTEGGKPLPLESALEVLRDKNDNVRLNVPISGDITDPKFSFTDAINQALVKGLTTATLSYLKYMLGPYGTAIAAIELGLKVGAKVLPAIRLKPIDFQPGTDDLDAAATEYLERVAAILKEKEDLRLRLCGWSTESDRTGLAPAAAETPPAAARPLAGKSETDGQGAATQDARFPLSDEEMLTLAKQRADQIEAVLVGQHGIDDKRILICKPEIDKNPEATPRVEMVF